MKIIHLQHKDSAVFNYRFDRPLGSIGAKKSYSLLRKNEKIRMDKLAERWKKKCDVLVIKYIDDLYTLDVIYTLRNMGAFKVVVDVDDNIWQIPAGSAAIGDPKKHITRGVMLTESVKAADYVTVSTETLKNVLHGLNDHIAVLPNLIEPSEWKFKRKAHRKTRIGWVWSPTHIPDNKEVEVALQRIHKKYGDKIEIVIFGTNRNIFDFDTINIPGVSYKEYPKTFMEAGIDISIAPLQNNPFNQCKSNIKWLESTMAGAAFIGSKVHPYETSIRNYKTGLLAKGESQWVKFISYLVENPDKRREIVKEARKEVTERYSMGNDSKWKNFYKVLCESSTK